jgi:hypothetical protein
VRIVGNEEMKDARCGSRGTRKEEGRVWGDGTEGGRAPPPSPPPLPQLIRHNSSESEDKPSLVVDVVCSSLFCWQCRERNSLSISRVARYMLSLTSTSSSVSNMRYSHCTPHSSNFTTNPKLYSNALRTYLPCDKHMGRPRIQYSPTLLKGARPCY